MGGGEKENQAILNLEDVVCQVGSEREIVRSVNWPMLAWQYRAPVPLLIAAVHLYGILKAG